MKEFTLVYRCRSCDREFNGPVTTNETIVELLKARLSHDTGTGEHGVPVCIREWHKCTSGRQGVGDLVGIDESVQ